MKSTRSLPKQVRMNDEGGWRPTKMELAILKEDVRERVGVWWERSHLVKGNLLALAGNGTTGSWVTAARQTGEESETKIWLGLTHATHPRGAPRPRPPKPPRPPPPRP